MKELIEIQSRLKAPKNQFNNFGKYNYRNCEDILEALKPLLKETKTSLTLSDEIVQIGDRYYVKASAMLYTEGGNLIGHVSAFARESETKKGMDDAQITGSASSYARKYALNGLFAIDDTKDADTTNNGKEKPKEQDKEPEKPQTESISFMTTDQHKKLKIEAAKESLTDEELNKVVAFFKDKYRQYAVKGKLTASGADYLIKNMAGVVEEFNIERAFV